MNKFPSFNAPRNISPIERLTSGMLGLFLLGFAMANRRLLGWLAAVCGAGLVYRWLSGHCKLYAAFGINTAGPVIARGRISVPGNRGIKVEKRVFIKRPATELFRTWRNFENLPLFMEHLEAVEVTSDTRSHWVARGPAGSRVEWDAEIINEHPGEMIAWRSLEGADVDHAGTVRFEAVEGGTEVRVSLEYDAAAGTVGSFVSRLFRAEPAQQIQSDLAHFKQLMESAG